MPDSPLLTSPLPNSPVPERSHVPKSSHFPKISPVPASSLLPAIRSLQNSPFSNVDPLKFEDVVVTVQGKDVTIKMYLLDTL